MSALAIGAPSAPARLRPMREDDLDAVMAIELRAYPFPWSRGIFRDCLRADYPARVLHTQDGELIGYGVLSVAADEAHVLNLCVASHLQERGHGRDLLLALLQLARNRGVSQVFLEVRPTNRAAIALYEAEGFNEIGRRPRYYPAYNGREDAIVMALGLTTK